jgi:hypothetical protein
MFGMLIFLANRGWFRSVPPRLVHWLAPRLAWFGTPHSCLFAVYLANFAGVTFSNETRELFVHACCEFKGGDERAIEMVRAKFLWVTDRNAQEDGGGGPPAPPVELVRSDEKSSDAD